MSRSTSVRRSLALTSALTLAMWGPAAVSASADPGHSNGHAQGSHASKAHASKAHAPKAKQSKAKPAHAKPAKAHAPKGHPAKGDHPSHQGGASHSHAPGSHAPSSHAPSNHAPSSHAPSSHAPKGGDKAPHGSKGSPAGNNGTVKIAPIGENDGTPQNHPHQVCGFQVEWYGYEQGSDIVSTVSFAMQAPTKDVGLTVNGPSSVFVGGDPATGAGTPTGLDGTQVYTLGFDGAPHPKQGYHVKITVSTPRSNGNDTKTKVFWVQPCTGTTPGGDTPGGGTPGTPGTPGGETPGGEDTGHETPGGGDTTGGQTPGGETMTPGDETSTGSQAQGGTSVRSGDRGQVPTAVEAGEGNAVLDLVSSPLPLLLIGLGALLTGAAFVTRRRARDGA